MEKAKINRINELARLKKQRPLTDAEAKEQQQLRQEYIRLMHNNLINNLNNISIKNPDGSVVKLEPKHKNDEK